MTRAPRMLIWLGAAAALAALAAALIPAQNAVSPVWHPPVERATGDEPITPIPLELHLDRDKVALGGRLFGDARLSRDGSVSCSHCHDAARGGADGMPRSVGVGGRLGAINAPTVYNSGFNFRQFWDGRAATLEEQVDGPLTNPDEMGSNWPDVIAKLGKDAAYVHDFAKIYPDGIKPDNVRDAIATYERSLTTPNSKFDRFLRGEKNALDGEEFAGYQLFTKLGCITCHQGVNIGGNLYEKLGLFENYFERRGNLSRADLGRYNVTHNEEERYEFRVPSLRNVALTAPYFHDASAETLDDAVATMARYQLGVSLKRDEIRHLVRFLNTLTGEQPSAAGAAR